MKRSFFALTVVFVSLLTTGGKEANQLPIGVLDGINQEGVASGWALDPDTPASIDVHFYIDAPADSGTLVGILPANLPRLDVNRVTGYAGDHGFNFKIPGQYWDGIEHLLYVYAIDSDGGASPGLWNSGRGFVLGKATGDVFDVGVEVVGSPEVVFSYTKDRCEDLDIPDAPARAFRDANGKVNLLATHYQNYRMVGDSLATVKKDCSKIMSSAGNPDFNTFKFAEWITSPYTLDGQNVYALVHNEWYAYLIDPKCQQREQINGWINAITLVVSRNRGASFSVPCDNIVVKPPLGWDQSFGCNSSNPTVFGAFAPSNIFKKDEFYYALFQSEKDPKGVLEAGTCLMRTSRLDHASAWQVWTNNGWEYSGDNTVCKPIARDRIEKMHESITWNTYLQAYVLIGTKFAPTQGVYFSTSKDLMSWTRAVKFLPASVVYASLIDSESSSRNFETSGQEGYVYYTRFNQEGSYLNRDLLRQKIRFVKRQLN